MDFADDPLLIECFLHLPPLAVWVTNPTYSQWIFDKQNETNKLVLQQQESPKRYLKQVLDDKWIICCAVAGDDYNRQWKFALTHSMIWPNIHWFHAMLGHPPALATCMLRCRHSTITHISIFTMNILLVMNVNKPKMIYSPIVILLVCLGRKLQMISLTHGQHQHHTTLWNSLLWCVLTPPLTLSKFHAFSKNIAIMLLFALSTPGSPSTLNQCKSSMTMGGSS